MTAPESIPVVPLHTASRIGQELRQALNLTEFPALTLGQIMRLKLENSPFINGGALSREDIQTAEEIAGIRGMMDTAAAVHAIEEQLDIAFRIFEIIHPTAQTESTPQYPAMSPEWMADIIAAACRAMPSLTYHQVLWEVPFAFIAHLVAAAHRANGGKTSRPFDVKAALAALDALSPKPEVGQ